MTSTTHRHTNRLADETSPYLLQHAHNPVDWYPWGEEAFAAAREQDKPIFLSVGYSACHWCHVMEHESFEDEGIAALMNEHFINVKVDREERPDVDQIYMNAVQLMTGRGGWPMSVFMTPDGKPFFGGTYWPPTSRMGMPGFSDLLRKLANYWETKRDDCTSSAAELTQALGQLASPQTGTADLNVEIVRNATGKLVQSADRKHGGFGGAPKFPHPFDIRVLLRGYRRFGDDEALSVARLTLDKMAAGGMYDQLGGGFHRYSTDAVWLVPHFEKMLYDNALLVPAYLEMWQIDKHERHRQVVRETLDYVLREMTSPEGGFYSTQDADSEGEEGKFFVWTKKEIDALLPEEDREAFAAAYGVRPGGNWEGKTILNRPAPLDEVAKSLGVDPPEVEAALARDREILFRARQERVAPGRDEKIITAWNGMMITAFAQSARVFGEGQDLEAAAAAAEFLWTTLRDQSGQLLHTYKDGRARFSGFLDDYAWAVSGLVELYQARFDPADLERATQIARTMLDQFADPDGGTMFYTPKDHEKLIARQKDVQDGAVPSGNNVAAMALLKLGRLTGNGELEAAGYQLLQALSGLMKSHPRAASQAVLALDFHLDPSFELVAVEAHTPEDRDSVRQLLAERFLPNHVLAVRPADMQEDDVPQVLQPTFAGKHLIDGDVTLYPCRRGACDAPVDGLEAIAAAVGKLGAPADD